MLKYSPTLVCIFFSIVILNLIKRSTLKQFLIRLFLWISQQNINCSLYSLWGVGKFNMEEQKPFLTGYWGNLEKIPEALSLIAFYFVAAFCRRNLQSLQERCSLSFSRCSESHEFKPLWTRATDRRNKIQSQRQRFHKTHHVAQEDTKHFISAHVSASKVRKFASLSRK